MIRRQFIKITSAAAALSVLPFSSCTTTDPELAKNLSLPITLATINDPTIIAEIGNEYLRQVPSENSAKQLIEKLLVDVDENQIAETTDDMWLNQQLLKKVKADFERGEIIVLNGWVLSKTEGRQCALYSLTQTDS